MFSGLYQSSQQIVSHNLLATPRGSSKHGKSTCGQQECEAFNSKTQKLRSKSAAVRLEKVFTSKNEYECQQCSDERRRRHRVLWSKQFAPNNVGASYDVCAHLRDDLRSDRCREALYIQMTNETVGNYAFCRARLFAQQANTQLIWIQAEDYLDDCHFVDLSQDEKKQRKNVVQLQVSPATNRMYSNALATMLRLAASRHARQLRKPVSRAKGPRRVQSS